MDSRVELAFNIKATVSVKEIKDELARQQSLLDEFLANPDGKEAEIAELKSNIGQLTEKKKYTISIYKPYARFGVDGNHIINVE